MVLQPSLTPPMVFGQKVVARRRRRRWGGGVVVAWRGVGETGFEPATSCSQSRIVGVPADAVPC